MRKINSSNEQILAQATLLSVLKGAKPLDSFGCWLLAGFGAALTFIITNNISKGIQNIKIPITIFIIATCICIIQKYLAVIITCGFEASEETERRISALTEKDKNILINFDFDKYCKEMEKPYWWPSKFIIRLFFQKIANGDLNAGAHLLIHCFQAQSTLVFIQAILLIICSWQLILKINP